MELRLKFFQIGSNRLLVVCWLSYTSSYLVTKLGDSKPHQTILPVKTVIDYVTKDTKVYKNIITLI